MRCCLFLSTYRYSTSWRIMLWAVLFLAHYIANNVQCTTHFLTHNISSGSNCDRNFQTNALAKWSIASFLFTLHLSLSTKLWNSIWKSYHSIPTFVSLCSNLFFSIIGIIYFYTSILRLYSVTTELMIQPD